MDHIVGVRDRARFVAPAASGPLVDRTRLKDCWAAGVGRVVRVIAPAGYGKSTLAAAWVSDDPRPVRWLSVECIDNDPSVFLHALAGGLAPFLDRPPEPPRLTSAASRDAEGAALSLGSALQRCHTPFVFVLDDIHRVDGAESGALIEAVASNLPAGCTLVLVGRAHHGAAAIPRLRLHPGVVEIGVEELAFDLTETSELLVRAGLDVGSAQLTALAAELEGWPAGLRLASLVMATLDEPDAAGASSLAAVPAIGEYLRAEWLGGLTPDDQHFVLEAACLDRFTAEACDVVLRRTGSLGRLRRLGRTGVVQVLDGRAERHRMHPLLRRCLEFELQGADRRRWRAIHRAAAGWCEAAGDIDAGLEHGWRIGDAELCGRLVVSHAPAAIARGDHRTAQRWLGTLTYDQLRNSEALCAVASLAALHAGQAQHAVQWARAARDVVDAEMSDGTHSASMWADVVHAAVARRPVVELVPGAERARAAMPGGVWRAFASWTLGGLQAVAGDEAAIDTLAGGAFEAEATGAVVLAATCLASSALAADLLGAHHEVDQLTARAAGLLSGHDILPTPAAALTGAAHALVTARQAEAGIAREHIAAARQAVSTLDGAAPWLHMLTRAALVRACLLADDPATGALLLRELDRDVACARPGDALLTVVDALGRRMAGARELLHERSWFLTSAELKVMRYLPTNLRLDEIATRLFVSRNTVKSHTGSIYRKLGTTSRTRAVELGRQAGLLADLDGVVP